MQRGRVLIAQRPSQKSFAHHWEFPGGKKREDETHVDALIRELKEELEIQLRHEDIQFIGSIENPPIHLHLYNAELKSPFIPREHEAIAWATFDQLNKFLLSPSDRKALEVLEKKIVNLFTIPKHTFGQN